MSETKQRICANGESMSPTIIGPYSDLTTALPTNWLYEVHDALTLALDATNSSVIPYRNVAESRSYLQAALANINQHLPALQIEDRAQGSKPETRSMKT